MSVNNNNYSNDQLSAPILNRTQSLRQPVDISEPAPVVQTSLGNRPEPTQPTPEPKVEETLTNVGEEDTISEEAKPKKDELAQIESEIDPEEETSEEQRKKERLEMLKLEASRRATINLGKPEDLVKDLNKVIEDSNAKTDEEIRQIRRDPNSKFNQLVDAYQRDDHTDGTAKRAINKDLRTSLEKAGNLTHEESLNSKEVTFAKQFKDGDDIVLGGKRGLAVFTALSGAVKKVYLPNSGISITLRTIPLDVLSNYYNAVAHENWEYGREFGEFYYTYAHLRVVKSLVDIILPVAVFGSNYVNWKSKDNLLRALSYHDLNTLAWAISTMLYPQGTEINYHCHNCNETITEICDLSKLKVTDSSLLSERATTLLKSTNSVSDDDLVKYQEALNFKKVISNTIPGLGGELKWEVTLKQANLYDYSNLGDEFLANLVENSTATEINRVTEYMFYNKFKQYKPWIDEIKCTTNNGLTTTLTVKNNDEEYSAQTIDNILSGFRETWPDFDKQVEEYILSTRITHTAFYMPKCPKCGKETSSIHGFIPFDAISYFFTLCYQRLVTDRYLTESKNG